MKNKKTVPCIVLAAMLFLLPAVLTGGCRWEQSSEKKPSGGTEAAGKSVLTVWAWDDSFNIAAARIAGERYEKNHPGIKIEVVSKEQEEIMQDLNTGFASEVYEDLPDVVLIEDYRIQKMLGKYEKEFSDLTNLIDSSSFSTYKIQRASKNGRVYGVPFDSGTAIMFYREDLIEQAGYGEKDMQDLTWSRYIEIAKAVREKTGKQMLTIETDDLGLIRVMMQSSGSWYIKQDGRTVNITDNAPLREAVSIYQEFLEHDLARTVTGWDGFVSAFQNGDVATVVSGCWIASTIKDVEEQSGLWRAARIPRLDKQEQALNASSIGGSSWYVLDRKGQEDAAKNFLKETFAEDKELINQLVADINLVPTRKDAYELSNFQKADPFFGGTCILQLFADTAEDIMDVNCGFYSYEIEEVFAGELQDILAGADLEECLYKAQIKAEAIVDEGR